MTGGSNNYIKQLYKILKLTIAVLAALLIVSCPSPMDDTLLAEVEDTVGPIITIISPDFSVQYFYPSDITITGMLTDYSDSSSTIEGSIESVVCVDLNYKGISLTPDNDVAPTATHFYTYSDGSFEIYIDTLTLFISGDFTLRITALDWNGNSSEKKLDLFDDVSGPNIGINDHGPSDYNFYSSALVGAPLIISGIVELPTYNLRYEVEAGGGPSIGLRDINYDSGTGIFSFPFDANSEGVSDTLKFIFRADDGLESVVWFYLTDDPDAPADNSHTFPSNGTLTVALSEGIYTTADGATGSNVVTEADFDLKLNGTALIALTDWRFSPTPTEGTESLQISITSGLPVTPDGTEVLTFAPKSNEVFDRVGNPADPLVFLITENLHDELSPSLVSAGQTDAKVITVVFTEDVTGGALTAANYQNGASAATGAVYGGNNTTVILTFPNDIVIDNDLNITADVIRDGDNNFFTGAVDWTIDDLYPPYIKDIKVWDINGSSYVTTGLFNDTEDLYLDVEFSETLTGAAPALRVTDGSGGSIATVFNSFITTTETDDTVRYFYNIVTGHANSTLGIDFLSGGSLTDTTGVPPNNADLDLSASFTIDTATIEIDAVAPIVNIDTASPLNLKVLGNIAATATGSDSGTFVYSWSGPGQVSFGTPSAEDTTVSASSDGTYTLTLTVTDAAGNSANDTIELRWDNVPPTITIGSELFLKEEGTTAAVTSDDRSGIASYLWSQENEPVGGSVTFGTIASENTTVSADVEGVYTLMLTVEDRAGNVETDTLSLTWDTTPPTIQNSTLTSPNGAEVWDYDSTQNITWASVDIDDVLHLGNNPISFDYSIDGGSWVPIAANEPNDGTYNWDIPDTVNSDKVKVRITATDSAGNTANDISDNDFTIDSPPAIQTSTLISPNGGESWTGGVSQTITWSSGDIQDAYNLGSSPISLHYSLNGGFSWILIVSGEANDGSYNTWVPPAITNPTVRIKITATDTSGKYASDSSNGNFLIHFP